MAKHAPKEDLGEVYGVYSDTATFLFIQPLSQHSYDETEEHKLKPPEFRRMLTNRKHDRGSAPKPVGFALLRQYFRPPEIPGIG